MLEVRVLGPLEVCVNGAALPLGTRKQQTVLATLAVQAGRVVGIEELIDELWPDDPPASAVPNARTYAANLRRLFDASESTRGLIRKQGDGYLLELDRSDVDLGAFLDGCQHARDLRAGRDPAKAAAVLSAALARWRGTMLAGVNLGPTLAARCAALEEERLLATEELADIHLELGQPAEAARLMRDQTRMHPLRERAYGLFMRARADTGDVAGALNAYAEAQRALGEELGIEPGPELRRLRQALLKPAAEPAPDPSGGPPASPAPLPGWLPRRITDFTGRVDLVARLLRAGRGADDDPVIKVIDGMAGSGKTALAVHVAHHLAERYPDAQLFIDLQGNGEGSPIEPAAALITLLRQIGVPAARIPVDVHDRIALWRREVAIRRAIVVLDNAASTDQVIPLLPTSARCVVLVTSRRRLSALEGGHPESLPVLSPEEAIELLANIVGSDAVKAERAAAGRVVARCGYLPLAIRLAGARLTHRPGWRLADLADRLQHQASVLTELTAENRSIASAFGLSYDPLRGPTKRMFRLLGLWPGEHFPVEAAAALSGLALPEAAQAIDELVDRHLVEEPDAGRFRLHDLMSEYANALTLAVDAASERSAAVRGLLDYYLHSVASVTEPLENTVPRRHLTLDPPTRPDLLRAQGPVDSDWLEGERSNVRALVRHAVRAGHDDYAWRIARVAWRFYYVRGYYDDIMDTHRLGLGAAERLGDHAAAGMMHNYLASAFVRISRYKEALGHLDRAIELCERGQDHSGARICKANVAVVYLWLGRLDEAVTLSVESLAEWRGSANDSIPNSLPNLALSLMAVGRHAESLRLSRIHLMMARACQDSFQIANALQHTGQVRLRMGQHRPAARILRSAIGLKHRIGNRYGESEALNDLATAYRLDGRLNDAEHFHRAALDAAEGTGEGHAEAAALNDLGLTLGLAGRRAEAITLHRRALAVATRISHPYEQARALAALADWLERDDSAEARSYRLRALVIYQRMNVPEQFDIERRLETA